MFRVSVYFYVYTIIHLQLQDLFTRPYTFVIIVERIIVSNRLSELIKVYPHYSGEQRYSGNCYKLHRVVV